MILSDIMNIWKKKDLLTQAINDSKEMLEIAYELYTYVQKHILEPNGKKIDIQEVKKRDYLLNHFDKSIRKKVFEHVSLNEKEDQDLYSAFILISIVKDMERLGDYTKNISEVAELRDRLSNDKYTKIAHELLKEMEIMFKETLNSYRETDYTKAQKINDLHFSYKTRIDNLLLDLVKMDNVESNLVIYGLLYRYLKRLSAHLMHITTSITNPIDEIGYYAKGDNKGGL
ncbi:MAG: hypothetical protein JXR48_11065 [Candidatus Delongbacteria bacterium]|nr:hypothetical protein [Candidatus Delongbacteria bacterium]MBN2835493.1 hypothetical protein [Candidatus Delongbacteria bacterium]